MVRQLSDEPPDFIAKREAASEAETEAIEALLTPEPTTLAGLRALAEHMIDHDEQLNGECCSDEPTRWALATIAETCRKLIPGGRRMSAVVQHPASLTSSSCASSARRSSAPCRA